MICVIDQQKQTRSQGGGIPCRRRYVLVPVDRPQGLSDGGPLGCRSQFDFLPVELAGVRPGPFSIPVCAMGAGSGPVSAKATVLFPSRQMSSRHNFRGGPVGVRFAGAPHTRLYLNSAHHIACKLADVPESHLNRLSSAAGFDVQQPDRKGFSSAQIPLDEGAKSV